MAGTIIGRRTWGGDRDQDGFRNYFVAHLVRTDSPLDGPRTVMLTSGLPSPGNSWSFGNDFDAAAICAQTMKVAIHQEKEGDPAKIWRVDQEFSVNARRTNANCEEHDNPLLEPAKIRGGSIHYTIEAQKTKFEYNGVNVSSQPVIPIVNSAHQLYRGADVEFNDSHNGVSISQNLASIDISSFDDYRNHVNDTSLWGFAPREVLLTDITWEKTISADCACYYTRHLDFEMKKGTFDKELIDEGTKVLRGKWDQGSWIPDVDADPSNPAHFMRAIDEAHNPTTVDLNGSGEPTILDVLVFNDLKYYPEADFLALGIPTNIETCVL